MAILITGGMGFIGLHTAKELVDAGERVVITRYRRTRAPDFVRERLGRAIALETLDVTDPARMHEVMERHEVTGVVHLAVPALQALSPAEEARVNIAGLVNLLEAARVFGVARLSLASSIAVYRGGGRPSPYREDDPVSLDATNSTATFKKCGELLADHFRRNGGAEVVSLRIGGIYGPLYHSMASLVSRLVHAAVRGTEIDLSASRPGAPYAQDRSDLCYVKDCARAIRMIQLAPTLRHRVYNLSAGAGVSNREVVDAIEKAVPGTRFDLPLRPPGEAASERYLDISRLRDELGFLPEYPIEAGVADYVGWLRGHEQ